MTGTFRLICVLLAAAFLPACRSGQQAPLLGKWKLADIASRPAGKTTGSPAVGTTYTFRPDSTLLIGSGPVARRYQLQKLPEGMFLIVGDSPAIQYRIVAMTPSELGLEQDRGESTLTMKLEFQPE